jgi:site-specific DNA-adenine methylase
MRFPGGKGKSYQHIVNILPSHSTYIETHLGGGAVLRNKKPAELSIGIDRDPHVIRMWRSDFPDLAKYVNADAVEFLNEYEFSGDEVVYCDPPYLPTVRRKTRIYRYEYSIEDHVRLLNTIRTLDCRVVISGYYSELYGTLLGGWNELRFRAKAQDGMRTESLWMNFSPPDRLHDARFWGNSYREREMVKRRLQRLTGRISRLSVQEQHHLSDWLADHLERR